MPKSRKIPVKSESAAKQSYALPVSNSAVLLVLSIFILHPIAISGQAYITIEAVKYYTFLTIVGYSVLVIAFAAMLTRIQEPKYLRWKGFPKLLHAIRPYEYAMIAYFVALLISTCLAYDPWMAFGGVNYRGEGFVTQTLYLITAALVARFYKASERDLMIFCATASVVALYAIFQFYGMDFLGFNIPGNVGYNYGTGITYISTMSNRNVASYYLGIALCISVVMFTRHTCVRKERHRWAFLVMGIILFYTILVAQTRGAYAGMLASVAVFFPFIADTRKNAARFLGVLAAFALLWWVFMRSYEVFGIGEPYLAAMMTHIPLLAVFLGGSGAVIYFVRLPKLPRRAVVAGWYVLVSAVIIAALISMPMLAQVTGSRTLDELSQMLTGTAEDSFGSVRIYPWRKSLELWAERPVFGWGPDNFFLVFMERYYEESMARYGMAFDKVHNEPLQILVSSGLAGLVSLMAYIGIVFRGILRKLKEPMALGVAVAMTCYLVHSMFAFSTPITHPIIWCMWGVLAGMGSSVNDGE